MIGILSLDSFSSSFSDGIFVIVRISVVMTVLNAGIMVVTIKFDVVRQDVGLRNNKEAGKQKEEGIS